MFCKYKNKSYFCKTNNKKNVINIMKNTFLLLLTIVVSSSMTLNAQKKKFPISEIEKDFPTETKLTFQKLGTYDLTGICYHIDNHIAWIQTDDRDEEEKYIGYCYNINTGKQISPIASKTENKELKSIDFKGDSIMIYWYPNTIKVIAKNDIINNILPEKRKVANIPAPTGFLISRMLKLPNGSILATIRPALTEKEKMRVNGINKNSVILFNKQEAKFFQTIDYNSFDIPQGSAHQTPSNELIKWSYAQGIQQYKNNDKAVFSVHEQFIIYTLDLNTGKVENEKRYTKMQRTNEEEISFFTTNDKNLSVLNIASNNRYIICHARGYFSEEDKKQHTQKEALFVFDWNLKPVKRFALTEDGSNCNFCYYRTDEDCQTIYFFKHSEEGVTTYKAMLNL